MPATTIPASENSFAVQFANTFSVKTFPEKILVHMYHYHAKIGPVQKWSPGQYGMPNVSKFSFLCKLDPVAVLEHYYWGRVGALR